jgi:hypothetical protein
MLRRSAYHCSKHCTRPCGHSEHRYESRIPSSTLLLPNFAHREVSCTPYRLHCLLQNLSLSHVHLHLLGLLLLLLCFALIRIHHGYDATWEDIVCLLTTTLQRPLQPSINSSICQELAVLLL